MDKKKTLYEILDVAPQAPQAEIKIAHLRVTQALQSASGSRTPAEIETDLKVLNMAFQTLSNEKLRRSYDARLNSQAAQLSQAPLTSLTLVPKTQETAALSMQAEAASLKADAANLMAQAALLKANSIKIHDGGGATLKVVDSVGKGLRFVLTMLGSFVVIILLLAWCGSGMRKADEKAQEKIIIQEHYQRYGVRPKSKAEAELMEAEYQRAEIAKREAEREVQKDREKEREHQRFVEESRRIGEQVSRNLQYESERAERQARADAERKAQQEQAEAYRKEEAERQRIASERRKLGLPP